MSTSLQPSHDRDEIAQKVWEHLNPRQQLLAALSAGGFPVSSIHERIVLTRSDRGEATAANLKWLQGLSGLGVRLLCEEFSQSEGELRKTKCDITRWAIEVGAVQADFIAVIDWANCDASQRINDMASIVGRSSSGAAR
jgi:hypothetical protein